MLKTLALFNGSHHRHGLIKYAVLLVIIIIVICVIVWIAKTMNKHK